MGPFARPACHPLLDTAIVLHYRDYTMAEPNFKICNFTVDHIVPKARGSTDHIENVQLLCGHCNSVKGTKMQEGFLAALRSR